MSSDQAASASASASLSSARSSHRSSRPRFPKPPPVTESRLLSRVAALTAKIEASKQKWREEEQKIGAFVGVPASDHASGDAVAESSTSLPSSTIDSEFDSIISRLSSQSLGPFTPGFESTGSTPFSSVPSSVSSSASSDSFSSLSSAAPLSSLSFPSASIHSELTHMASTTPAAFLKPRKHVNILDLFRHFSLYRRVPHKDSNATSTPIHLSFPHSDIYYLHLLECAVNRFGLNYTQQAESLADRDGPNKSIQDGKWQRKLAQIQRKNRKEKREKKRAEKERKRNIRAQRAMQANAGGEDWDSKYDFLDSDGEQDQALKQEMPPQQQQNAEEEKVVESSEDSPSDSDSDSESDSDSLSSPTDPIIHPSPPTFCSESIPLYLLPCFNEFFHYFLIHHSLLNPVEKSEIALIMYELVEFGVLNGDFTLLQAKYAMKACESAARSLPIAESIESDLHQWTEQNSDKQSKDFKSILPFPKRVGFFLLVSANFEEKNGNLQFIKCISLERDREHGGSAGVMTSSSIASKALSGSDDEFYWILCPSSVVKRLSGRSGWLFKFELGKVKSKQSYWNIVKSGHVRPEEEYPMA